jgi:linalool 8-monooxygenase
MRRTATADTELAGVKIARGDKVVMWYPAGNRDPAAFEAPDRLDLSRRQPAHLGFGTGQHICAGSRLAEMQLRIAFEQLAKHVARFEVVHPPRRLRSNFISGIKELQVVLHPPAATVRTSGA